MLRRILIWSGAALGLLGAGLVVMLPVEGPLRWFLVMAWVASVWREIMIHRRAFARCLRLRVSQGGDVSIFGPDGVWRSAELVSGCILLRRLGWIRLRESGQRNFGELLAGDRRRDRDWRRLHVIWRHFGA